MTKIAEFTTAEFAESYKKRAENAKGYTMKLVYDETERKYFIIDPKQDAQEYVNELRDEWDK